jgi:PAS domain S-box-containing protein
MNESIHKIIIHGIQSISSVSLEGKCFKANKALAKIMGYDSLEAVYDSSRIIDDLVWLDNSERGIYVKLLDKQEAVLGFECQFRKLNGEIIWVSINAKLIRDENGNKLYYEGFILDITERKENELTIKKKMEELQWHYDIAINRELKMVELKKEINSLLEELNRDKKYN